MGMSDRLPTVTAAFQSMLFLSFLLYYFLLLFQSGKKKKQMTSDAKTLEISVCKETSDDDKSRRVNMARLPSSSF